MHHRRHCYKLFIWSQQKSEVLLFFFFFFNTKQIFCHRVETNFSTPESCVLCQSKFWPFLSTLSKIQMYLQWKEGKRGKEALPLQGEHWIFWIKMQIFLSINSDIIWLYYLYWLLFRPQQDECLFVLENILIRNLHKSMLYFLIKSKIWLQKCSLRHSKVHYTTAFRWVGNDFFPSFFFLLFFFSARLRLLVLALNIFQQ